MRYVEGSPGNIGGTYYRWISIRAIDEHDEG
jgi:hypothetical protein